MYMVGTLIIILSVMNKIGFNNIYNSILDTKKFTDATVPTLALIIATLGLYTWRKQLKGSHSYMLAANIRSNSFDFIDEVNKFRKQTVITLDSDIIQRNFSLFEKVTLSSSKLISLLNSSRTILPEKKIIEAIQSVNSIVMDQSVSLSSLSISSKYEFRNEQPSIFTSEDKKILVYSGLSEDPINNKLNALIESIKKMTKPYIK